MSDYLLSAVGKRYEQQFSANYPHKTYVLDGIIEEISKINQPYFEPILLGELEKKLKDVCEIRTNERASDIEKNMRKSNTNNRRTNGKIISDEEVQENLTDHKNLYSGYVDIIKNVLSTDVKYSDLVKDFSLQDEYLSGVIKNNNEIKKANKKSNDKQKISIPLFYEAIKSIKPFYNGKQIDIERINNNLVNTVAKNNNWRETLSLKNAVKEYAIELNRFKTGNIAL